MKNNIEKVGILGGTFNPIHKGHIFLATKSIEEMGLLSTFVLPLNDPPHKSKPKVSNQNRLDMVFLAIEGYANIKCLDLELRESGKTFTINTLKKLSKIYPEFEFNYIIGSDTLLELKNWKDYRSIFDYCSFICFERTGIRKDLVDAEIRRINETFGEKIYLSKYKAPSVSSSMIREMISNGEDVSNYIDEKVYDYIKNHNIYI